MYVCIATGLVLRDILQTACNIMNATYKGWVGDGSGEWGGWRGRVGGWVHDASRHRQPSYICAYWARLMATAALTIP